MYRGSQEHRFCLGGQHFALSIEDKRLNEHFQREIGLDWSVPATKKRPTFSVSVKLTDDLSADDTSETRILPLAPPILRLKREKLIKGWQLGNYLQLGDGQNRLRLNYSRRQAVIYLNEAIFDHPRLFTHSYLLIAVIELLRTLGVYYLHGAAAVSTVGDGLLLLCDGGSGKSTQALLLCQAGWQVVADDALLLRRIEVPHASIIVEPLLPRLCLDGELIHRFAGLQLVDIGDEGKGRVVPASLPKPGFVPSATINQALILSPTATNQSSLTPVSRGLLTAEMIKQNAFLFLHPQLARQHLELLGELASRCRGWRLDRGVDLLDEPDRLATLLGQCEPQVLELR